MFVFDRFCYIYVFLAKTIKNQTGTSKVLNAVHNCCFTKQKLWEALLNLAYATLLFQRHGKVDVLKVFSKTVCCIQVVQYQPFGHYHGHLDSNPIEGPTVPCCHQNHFGKSDCRVCRWEPILTDGLISSWKRIRVAGLVSYMDLVYGPGRHWSFIAQKKSIRPVYGRS